MSLHRYQDAGVEFLLARRYAYLADTMGLGKTVQACVAAARLPGLMPPRVLVICPAVARPVWVEHWRKWGPACSGSVVLRQLTDRIPLMALAHGCMVIASYDYARENAYTLSGVQWDVLILDEAQMAKSHEAKRTRALFGTNPPGIARSAKRVWWLSGTPVENHPGEIWLPLYFTGKTQMPRDAWVQTYCEVYDYNGSQQIKGAKTHMIPALRQTLKATDFFLRRTRQEVFPDLPKRAVTNLVVEAQMPTPQEMEEAFPNMDLSERELKVSLERELIAHALGADAGLNAASMAVLQGLAQSVSTLRRYSGMLKVAPVVEHLKQQLGSGQLRKIALFYVHDAVGAALMHRLRKFNPVRICGATGDKARERHVESFNHDPECRVFIGQLRACGTALSLTDCTDAMAVETDWDPGSLAQALHRVRRPPGDKTPIFSSVVTLDEPLDRAVHGLIARKAREIEETWL